MHLLRRQQPVQSHIHRQVPKWLVSILEDRGIISYFIRIIGSDPPIEVAPLWAAQFKSCSSQTGDQAAETVRAKIKTIICNDFEEVLQSSPIPQTPKSKLYEIVDIAYKWNDLVRGGRVDHLCRPFSPRVGSGFDSRTSIDYYDSKPQGDPIDAKVEAVACMGLEMSDLKAKTGSLRFIVPGKGKATVLLNIPPESLGTVSVCPNPRELCLTRSL